MVKSSGAFKKQTVCSARSREKGQRSAERKTEQHWQFCEVLHPERERKVHLVIAVISTEKKNAHTEETKTLQPDRELEINSCHTSEGSQMAKARTAGSCFVSGGHIWSKISCKRVWKYVQSVRCCGCVYAWYRLLCVSAICVGVESKWHP